MLKLISSENKSLKKYSYVVDCSYRYSICDLLVTSIIQEGRLQFVEFIKITFYCYFTGTNVLAAALQKKNARKRRGGPGGGSLSMSRDASLDEEVTPATPGGSITGDLVSIPNTPITPNVPSTPRMTGSLAVPGHGTDDIITRMKNIELVELGRHKFKPW